VSDRPACEGSAEGGTCAEALVDDLGWGLGVLFRAYARAAAAAVADLPGGSRGYQVLAAAAGGQVGSQLALAQLLGIDRTVMTYLLDDLEQAGLIARQLDPADRRARRVVATRKGADLLLTLDQRLRAAEALLMAPLDEVTAQTFRAQVRLLATRANAADPIGNPCELAEQTAAFTAAVAGTVRGRTASPRSPRPQRG
jgi:DNA-binding MarR family transcriptional regulator